MELEIERKLIVIEIRLLAAKLQGGGGQNPLTSLGVDLESLSLSDLRSIRGHFRDTMRSLGGSRE